jgi:YegS/Rv2252/BmrU family lipid kinase
MIGFIINPVSGNGRGRKVWATLEGQLQQNGRFYRAFYTTGPGDATRLAASLYTSGQYCAIVAVGGDGTVNEAAAGLWEARSAESAPPTPLLTRQACAFGCIPAGSGNDFARGYGIPDAPEQALAVLLQALDAETAPEPMDLLRLGRKIAVSTISCGFDGQVAQTTNKAIYKKWLNALGLGKLAYVLSVVRVLFTYKPRNLTLVIDGKSYAFEAVWLVAAGNIPYYGGGMKICPDARPDDGLASLCVVHGIGRFHLLRVFPLVFKGRHVGHPAVQFFSGTRLEILPSAPLMVQADGEPVTAEQLVIEVIPAFLPVLKPITAKLAELPLVRMA